jgi:hypothetical protein
MRRKLIVSAGLLQLGIGICSAQPAQEQSAYCRSAAVAFFKESGDAEYAIVRQKCKRGDTIAINTAAQGAVFHIARLCDFSKAIVVTGPTTICVLVGERPIR